ncbi:MAG: hypothetical protein LAT64_12810 [Phycisphaerales bacterium]|nr:hypothetical protein [Planctomycetota bacterium]MCH8509635.1 hypothetical protein [Phycisphaerales bacterium]
MKRIIVIVLFVLLLFPIAGTMVRSWYQGFHPVKFVLDRLTGFQAGHPRHDFPPEQAVRWDPIGDHNATVAAMAREDRAYPLIAEATARLRAMPDEIWGKEPGRMVPDFIRANPGDAEWPRLLAWTETEPVRGAMALVREAARKPVMGAPFLVRDDPEWVAILAAYGVETPADPTPPPAEPLMLGALLPHLGSIRGLAVMCDAHARLAVDRGDAEALMDAIEDIFGLASHASEPKVLIAQIVRVALLIMAADRIADTLVHHPDLIDDAAAARFDALLMDALADGWTDPEPATELVIFEDVIRRMVDNRGVFDPRLVLLVMPAVEEPSDHSAPSASTAPLAAFSPDLLASYSEAERYAVAADQAITVPFGPYSISEQEMNAWSEGRDSVPGRIGRKLLGILAPKWSKVAVTFRTTHQQLIGVRMVLAAHRHHLRHGEPPASLDAIDTDLLTFEPVDGFTGGRLVYRWMGEGHLVYALGADGDDDGGRHVVGPDGEPVGLISDEYLRGRWDGDWVVFPPRE